jgi:Putative Flp pilus-assembly TadE/G-like
MTLPMKGTAVSRRSGHGGQTIVVVALALIPLLLAAGLVIDGGWAFSQQRRTQNGVDAAANAGAVALVENLPFRTRGATEPRTDADVWSRIVATADDNEVGGAELGAIYTDIDGEALDPEVAVGSLGAAPPPAAAYGVRVHGSRSFGTFFSGVAGFSGFDASADATAIAGAVTELCGSEEPCEFIPVTFPTALTDCVDNGKQTAFGSGGPYTIVTTFDASTEIIIPLCGTSAGSVGWLDIQPDNPACNGEGANELACNIVTPNHGPLPVPIWIATTTGNTNTTQVQDALDTFTGDQVGVYEPGEDKIVQVPLYECIDNDVPQPSHDRPCPDEVVEGIGSHTSYRIVAIGAMVLDRAYIQANNPECNEPPGGPPIGGNGKNGCLKGWLTQISTTGQVGLPTGTPGTVWGVNLIQ